MSFAKLNTTQVEFLERYLRGTGRTLSSFEAREIYGIKNLRARMTDLRHSGLRVRRQVNEHGYSDYAVSARDVNGSRALHF